MFWYIFVHTQKCDEEKREPKTEKREPKKEKEEPKKEKREPKKEKRELKKEKEEPKKSNLYKTDHLQYCILEKEEQGKE